MFSSNCCFLTCIQVSQEAGQVVWCSHLFQNFPQFIVIHTVKGFGIVNKADVFLELSCFFDDLADVGNLISGSSAISFFSSTTLLLPTHLPPSSCTHAQSCNPMDCSSPGSSVHGLYQARTLEWVAISFSILCLF